MDYSTIKCIDLKSNNRLQIGAICDLLTIISSDVIFFKENNYSKLYLIEDCNEYVLLASIDSYGNMIKDKKYSNLSNDYILKIEPTIFSNLKIAKLTKIKFLNVNK